jgi:hypothetical protein
MMRDSRQENTFYRIGYFRMLPIHESHLHKNIFIRKIQQGGEASAYSTSSALNT